MVRKTENIVVETTNVSIKLKLNQSSYFNTLKMVTCSILNR